MGTLSLDGRDEPGNAGAAQAAAKVSVRTTSMKIVDCDIWFLKVASSLAFSLNFVLSAFVLGEIPSCAQSGKFNSFTYSDMVEMNDSVLIPGG